jgi:hypothetical protein
MDKRAFVAVFALLAAACPAPHRHLRSRDLAFTGEQLVAITMGGKRDLELDVWNCGPGKVTAELCVPGVPALRAVETVVLAAGEGRKLRSHGPGFVLRLVTSGVALVGYQPRAPLGLRCEEPRPGPFVGYGVDPPTGQP